MNSYTAVIVALLSGCFALLGVLVSNRLNRQQVQTRLRSEREIQKEEIIRERLEELYVLVDKWAGAAIIHHTTLRKVMNGEIDYNQALEIELDQKHDFDAHRMFMLAELYFTDCHCLLPELKKTRDEASQIQQNYKQLYKTNGLPSKEYSKQITTALTKFNTSVDTYKQSLAEYARTI
jgi:hypothetical protein